MNANLRKVALIAAVLGLLLSLFIALRPGGDETAPPTTTTTATTTASGTTDTEPPTPTLQPAPPEVVTIRIAIPGDTAPKVRRYSVRQGRKVVIIVRTALSERVHLHGYDLMADVGPGKPATIRFTATAPGRFELELEAHRLPIAELEVRP